MRNLIVLTLALALLAACDEGMPAGEVTDIAPGSVLPYGEVARVCGLDEGAMGVPVATGARYTLWDSQPGTVAPRSHYVTGMSGRCAVQFTAALALFGDVGTHEVVRYNPANQSRPWTATDTAYEEVKARFCGAGQGQPCGARINALARQSTFVTVYPAFGTNPNWIEVFLHDGALVAYGPAGG